MRKRLLRRGLAVGAGHHGLGLGDDAGICGEVGGRRAPRLHPPGPGHTESTAGQDGAGEDEVGDESRAAEAEAEEQRDRGGHAPILTRTGNLRQVRQMGPERNRKRDRQSAGPFLVS